MKNPRPGIFYVKMHTHANKADIDTFLVIVLLSMGRLDMA